MPKSSEIGLVQNIDNKIHQVRGQRVIKDSDLAQLFGVTTKRLNEQVKRNYNRFPPDFSFQLKDHEVRALRSQIATSKNGPGGHRYRPRVFTEHGVIMAANVLNNRIAIRVSVQIVRAFIRLRELLATHQNLARRIDDLERKYDENFRAVFDAIRELMTPSGRPKRKIGFQGEPVELVQGTEER